MHRVGLPHATFRRSPRGRVRGLAWLSCLLVLLAACGGSDATGPSRADVAGSYSATTFLVTSGGTTTDVLAEGGSVDIVLNADGTTTGRLFVPGGDVDGGDLDVALDGSWTLSGNTVHFAETQATFIEDVPFTADGQTLSTDASVPAGVRIQLVLSKLSLSQ